MKKDIPCKPDCPDRSPTCHGTCERYAAFAAKVEAERAERQRQADIDSGQIVNRERFWNIIRKGSKKRENHGK